MTRRKSLKSVSDEEDLSKILRKPSRGGVKKRIVSGVIHSIYKALSHDIHLGEPLDVEEVKSVSDEEDLRKNMRPVLKIGSNVTQNLDLAETVDQPNIGLVYPGVMMPDFEVRKLRLEARRKALKNFLSFRSKSESPSKSRASLDTEEITPSKSKASSHDILLGEPLDIQEVIPSKSEASLDVEEIIPSKIEAFEEIIPIPSKSESPSESEASLAREKIIPSKSEASVVIREKQVNQLGVVSPRALPFESELLHSPVNQPGCTSTNSLFPCIFSWPKLLGFKEPKLVSIGPYHRNKNLPLDKFKYSFLEKFLSRTRNQGKDLCFYVRQMMKLEWLARRCYSEELSIPSSEFVEMMLVDSCFITEILYHFGQREESENGIFPIEPWKIPILVRDLLLLENQIPFFVLEKLFDLSKTEEGTATVSVSTMALQVFDLAFPAGSMDFSCKFSHLEVVPKHLLDLLLKTIRPSNLSTDSTSLFLIHLKGSGLLNSVLYWLFPNQERDQMGFSKKEDDMLLKSPATGSKQNEYEPSIQSKPSTSETAKVIKKVYSLKSAGELRRSGIEFRPRRADRFTDIHFKYGVLEIPPITINDLFITILFNCVAFEQRSPGCSKDITAYVSFLSGLIRYPSDVEYLSSDGILSRFSDENEGVASSFNYLQSMVSDLDILQDSYLFKTVMEIEGYYTGNRIMTRIDPRVLLFCITSVWFAFFFLKLI